MLLGCPFCKTAVSIDPVIALEFMHAQLSCPECATSFPLSFHAEEAFETLQDELTIQNSLLNLKNRGEDY